MDQLSDKLSIFVLRNRKWVIGIVSFLTVFFCWNLSKIQVNNEFDIWFAKDNKIYEGYSDFKKHFGDDRSLIVIYQTDSLFSEYELSVNRELSNKLKQIEGVKNVISLSLMRVPEITPFYIVNKKLISAKENDPELLKNEICSQQIFIDNLLSKDGKATAIQVLPTDSVDLTYIYEQSRLVLSEMPESNRYIFVGGIPITVESKRLSSQEPPVYLAVAIVLMIILLFIIFRNFLLAIIPVIIAAVSIIWTLAILSLSGGTINMLSGIIPLILLAMSITFTIHMISSFRKFSGWLTNTEVAIRESCKEVLLPGGIAMLTTAFAFLAFGFSHVEPIRIFGLYTALGIFISFVLSFLLLPLFFLRFGSLNDKKQLYLTSEPDRFSQLLSRFVIDNRIFILLMGTLILIGSIIGLSKLHFESDQIKYLKKTNKVKVANDIAGKWFSGIYPFEMIFNIEDIPDDSLYKSFQDFKALEKKLLQLNGVEICHSANGLMQVILSRNKHIISEKSLVEMYLKDGKNKTLENSMKHFISKDRKRYRITVKSKWINNQGALELMDQLNQEVRSTFQLQNTSFYITGAAPMYVALNNQLLDTQLISLGFSLLIIITIFIFVYRNPILFIPGILPNLFPVMNTLGIMGFLDIPMDAGTVLIASISLGVAVDDTVYFLTAFKNFRKQYSVLDAIKLSYNKVWKALTITTTILILGFFILIFSNYKPIIYLGIFVSLNLFFALLYDFLVLPSLIIFFSFKKHK